MSRRLRHAFSTLIGAILYLLFRSPPDPAEEAAFPSILVINESNFSNLKSGSWMVVTERFKLDSLDIRSEGPTNYGVLVVNSMGKARIAALLGLENPADFAIINNGIVASRKASQSIDLNVPFQKIIDYFVYYWAIHLKSIFRSASSLGEMVELLAFSSLMLLFEIFRYAVAEY